MQLLPARTIQTRFPANLTTRRWLDRKMDNRAASRLKKSSLFTPLYPESKLSSHFIFIKDHPGYRAARRMLEKVHQSYEDKDGNFIEQFQTTGFDARIWELYLHACLREAKARIHSSANRPDFHFTIRKVRACIEAVTTNPKPGERGPDATASVPAPTEDHMPPSGPEFDAALGRYVAKLSRAINKKLSKDYTNDASVTGKAFALAVEPFHNETSLSFGDSWLGGFLYGQAIEKQGAGADVPYKLSRVEKRKLGALELPYGFFNRKDARGIGAVMFSNSGTIAKFHRMGVQAGYKESTHTLIRAGICHDLDPKAFTPKQFAYQVGDPRYKERWGQGMTIFHNPSADIPFPKKCFRDAVEFWWEGDELNAMGPAFSPISSTTYSFSPKSK